MKKAFKLLVGLIIVYIMIYSCNKRLSSKYETSIKYNLEKEKQEKLLKEKEIPAIDPFKDTVNSNSSNYNNVDNKEKDSKHESLAKKWAEITSADAHSTEVISPATGTTTSASQLEKASQAPAGQFKKVLNEKK